MRYPSGASLIRYQGTLTMKKMLFIFLLLTYFCACSNDTSPTLTIEGDQEMIFDQQGGEQVVYVSVENITLTMDESAKEWCQPVVFGKRIIVSTTYNNTQSDRKVDITIHAGQSTSVLSVVQNGIGTISLDEKLVVSGGEASSEHTQYEDTGFANSFDGDLTTFWHTDWSASPPHTATYNLQNAEKLDYIMYYPRSGGGNGTFGEVEIYVSTEEVPGFTKIITYNHGGSGSASKITLPSPVQKPKAVKFVILSGSNGNASCSEMEFYSSTGGTVSTKDIPLGGNSYVTSGGSDGGSVTDAGFTSWTSTSTVFSTFFRVNNSGD